VEAVVRMTTMMVVGATLIQMPNRPLQSDRVAVVAMADGIILTQMTIRDQHPDVKNAVVPDLTVVDLQKQEVVVGLTTDVVVIVVAVMIAAVVMIVVVAMIVVEVVIVVEVINEVAVR
jgi:hypothetical protein